MGRGGGTVVPDRKIEFPDTVRSRDTDNANTRASELRLQGNDTLLQYLEVRKYEGPEPKVPSSANGTGVTGQNANPANGAAVLVPPPADSRILVVYTAERAKELNEIRDRIQRRNPDFCAAFGSTCCGPGQRRRYGFDGKQRCREQHHRHDDRVGP